jgi:hypothetical protein
MTVLASFNWLACLLASSIGGESIGSQCCPKQPSLLDLSNPTVLLDLIYLE